VDNHSSSVSSVGWTLRAYPSLPLWSKIYNSHTLWPQAGMRQVLWWGRSGPMPDPHINKLPGFAFFSPTQSIPTTFILPSRSCDLCGPQVGHHTHDHPAFTSSRHSEFPESHSLLSAVHKLNSSFLDNRGWAAHFMDTPSCPEYPPIWIFYSIDDKLERCLCNLKAWSPQHPLAFLDLFGALLDSANPTHRT
jgi:hypothetical protein